MCLKVLIDASTTYDSVLEKFEKWVNIENRLLEMSDTGSIYREMAEALKGRSEAAIRNKPQAEAENE